MRTIAFRCEDQIGMNHKGYLLLLLDNQMENHSFLMQQRKDGVDEEGIQVYPNGHLEWINR